MAGLAERIGGEESSEEAWICWNSMLRKRINLYPCSLGVQFVKKRTPNSALSLLDVGGWVGER